MKIRELLAEGNAPTPRMVDDQGRPIEKRKSGPGHLPDEPNTYPPGTVKRMPDGSEIEYTSTGLVHRKSQNPPRTPRLVDEHGVAEGTGIGDSVFVEGCGWDDVVAWLNKNVGPTTKENPNWANGWFGKGWELYPARYTDASGKVALLVRAVTNLSKEELKSQIETACKSGVAEGQLNELSPQTLASYKRKAGKQASELDRRAFHKDTDPKQAKQDIAKANKRFSGIVRATRKEFGK